MALQCYIAKVAIMPTDEIVERINLLNGTFGGGDTPEANTIANHTVSTKIRILKAELRKRNYFNKK